MSQVVHIPYVVEQDEDGAWCASAMLRPGVGAFGEGATSAEAITDLRAALETLLEVVGPPTERRHLLRPQARDPLHLQRRGAARVLHRADRTPPKRPADPQQRVDRGPLGTAAAEVLGYTMDRSMRIRISDFLSRTGSPVVT